ncbi:hypothetical protein BDV09DRAFT_163327 [Aspergillus tetrazonus]
MRLAELGNFLPGLELGVKVNYWSLFSRQTNHLAATKCDQNLAAFYEALCKFQTSQNFYRVITIERPKPQSG